MSKFKSTADNRQEPAKNNSSLEVEGSNKRRARDELKHSDDDGEGSEVGQQDHQEESSSSTKSGGGRPLKKNKKEDAATVAKSIALSRSSALQAKWDGFFERLLLFRQKHGHCRGTSESGQPAADCVEARRYFSGISSIITRHVYLSTIHLNSSRFSYHDNW
jgi:hypothetical protein